MDVERIPQAAGRPRTRPQAVACDKGYSCRWIRQWLYHHKVRAVIPRKCNERSDGRMTFEPDDYRRRSVIECCVGWLKECRRLGTRFEKLAINLLAMLKLAMIQRCPRITFSDSA